MSRVSPGQRPPANRAHNPKVADSNLSLRYERKPLVGRIICHDELDPSLTALVPRGFIAGIGRHCALVLA